MDTPAAPLITGFSVRDLFGRRSYDVNVPVIDGQPSKLVLIHGDNGSGKTTLLKLIWNALSAADNRGHRSFIAKTPFTTLLIRMTGGRLLHIEKTDGLQGSFEIVVSRPGAEDVRVRYEAEEDLKISRPSRLAHRALDLERWTRRYAEDASLVRPSYIASLDEDRKNLLAEEQYFAFLAEEIQNPLLLADDRSLYSDDPEIYRTREALARREESDPRVRLSRLVFIELQATLRRVNDYIRSLTLGGQNDGSANSNAIYMEVLRRLAEPTAQHESETDQLTEIHNLLAEIANVSPGYEKYGLVPSFDVVEFRRLLDIAQRTEISALSLDIVAPFLSSMRARYSALEEAHDLLQSFIPTINSFLTEKELHFTPRIGLRIVTSSDQEQLDVESLSSGERQLLMLLATTVLARNDTKLFIIDEPELSLGVEWQRNILESLLDLTDTSELQFLVATHSIEIISSHPEALVQLVPQ